MEANYYEILDISPDCADSEIKKAYRNCVKKYHPDVNKNAGSNEIFMIIQEAYECLINPESRQIYDRELNYNNSKFNDFENTNSESDIKHSKDNYEQNDYQMKKFRFNFSLPAINFDFEDFGSGLLVIIRVIIFVIALLIIPFFEFRASAWDLNELLIYYGWALFLYCLTGIIYYITTLGLIISFIYHLFQGDGITAMLMIPAFLVMSLVVFIIKPSFFDRY
ncbi:MAG: J domain-containing protein [Erysipelotrichaceae bacterium]